MAVPELTRLLFGFKGQLVMNPTMLPTAANQASPAAPSLSLSETGGFVTPGVHKFAMSFTYASGEGPLGAPVSIAADGSTTAIQVACVVSLTGSQTGVNVYATTSGGVEFWLIDTITTSRTISFEDADANIPNAPYPQAPQIGAFPYGGVQLGEIADVRVRPRRRTYELEAEEYGAQVVERLDMGPAWRLWVALRGCDPDAMQQVFETVGAGAVSGRPLQTSGLGYASGQLLTQTKPPFEALLVPTDTNRLPSFLFYALLGVPDESAELTLQLDLEGTTLCVFDALPNASGNVEQWGQLVDLTL